jgi:hypothetical protein
MNDYQRFQDQTRPQGPRSLAGQAFLTSANERMLRRTKQRLVAFEYHSHGGML